MRCLSRQTALGEQRIEMTPESWSDRHWDIWLSCEIEPRLPADLAKWCELQHTIPLASADVPDLAACHRNPGVRKPFEAAFRCQGKEQLEHFVGLYVGWVERDLLPLLEACAGLPIRVDDEQVIAVDDQCRHFHAQRLGDWRFDRRAHASPPFHGAG